MGSCEHHAKLVDGLPDTQELMDQLYDDPFDGVSRALKHSRLVVVSQATITQQNRKQVTKYFAKAGVFVVFGWLKVSKKKVLDERLEKGENGTKELYLKLAKAFEKPAMDSVVIE